jgi:uncharacterized protein YbjT (DUF2867 family)
MEVPSERERNVLVLGGTGKTGRRVVERLEARGVPVGVGSRSTGPPFDWEDRTRGSPRCRMSGRRTSPITLILIWRCRARSRRCSAFAGLAVESGVRRLVLLSGRGEGEAQSAEAALREVSDGAGVEWTVVRCTWFNQNFSESYLLDPVLDGEVVLPAGDVPEPFVDAEDIADVAVAALMEEGHTGEVYELTGPRLLTFGEAVGEISEAAGREIHYVPVSVEDYTSALIEEGVPEEYVSLVTYLFAEVLDGRDACLTDGVARALGREPRDFRNYASEVAAAT